MNAFNRRNFVFASSGAVAGTLAVPGLLEAAASGPIDFSQSGLVTGTPKPLKHKEIPGFLSAAQIAPHHTAHYGWAMLVKHPVNGKLYNVVSDEHAMGVLWMAMPIIVIDTYEHAFYIDYQNRKADYVEKFMAHIDWIEANSRFEASSR